jgi:hypothetical protein
VCRSKEEKYGCVNPTKIGVRRPKKDTGMQTQTEFFMGCISPIVRKGGKERSWQGKEEVWYPNRE